MRGPSIQLGTVVIATCNHGKGIAISTDNFKKWQLFWGQLQINFNWLSLHELDMISLLIMIVCNKQF